MDVRRTAEWAEIKEFMANLTFRTKRLGGLDGDSVVEGVNELTGLYNKWVEALFVRVQAAEGRAAVLEEEYRRKESLLESEHRSRMESLESETLGKGEQLLAALEKADSFCDQLKADAQAQADGIVGDAETRASELLRQAEEKAAESEAIALGKAEKIVEQARMDAFETVRKAKESAERAAEERARDEREIAVARAKAATFAEEMRRVLSEVSAICAPERDSEGGGDGE